MKHDTLTLLTFGAACGALAVAADGEWRERRAAAVVDVSGSMINVHGSASVRITENTSPSCGFAVYDNGVFKHGVEFECEAPDAGVVDVRGPITNSGGVLCGGKPMPPGATACVCEPLGIACACEVRAVKP